MAVVIDGVTYEVNDKLKEFFVGWLKGAGALVEQKPEPKKKGPFERVEDDAYYFFIGSCGDLSGECECADWMDDGRFRVANYCTDKCLMEQRALHETLNRLLWRYSEEHGGDSEWNNANEHWRVARNTQTECFCLAAWSTYKVPGTVYFRDEETAKNAIRDVVEPFVTEHPEFKW